MIIYFIIKLKININLIEKLILIIENGIKLDNIHYDNGYAYTKGFSFF